MSSCISKVVIVTIDILVHYDFGSSLEVLPSTSSAENVGVQRLVELIARHGVGGGPMTA